MECSLSKTRTLIYLFKKETKAMYDIYFSLILFYLKQADHCNG